MHPAVLVSQGLWCPCLQITNSTTGRRLLQTGGAVSVDSFLFSDNRAGSQQSFNNAVQNGQLGSALNSIGLSLVNADTAVRAGLCVSALLCVGHLSAQHAVLNAMATAGAAQWTGAVPLGLRGCAHMHADTCCL